VHGAKPALQTVGSTKSRLMPTAVKSKLAGDFSLVSFIRSLTRDADLLPGEGRSEAAAVAVAGEREAAASRRTIRGHVLPLIRESGGQQAGTFGTGGALVSGSLMLADALQPVLQLEKLGARRVNGGAGDLLVSAPGISEGFWIGEDQNVPVSAALFGASLMAPKEAATRIKMARRLFKQAGAVGEQEFREVLRRTIASTIEGGILNGSGNQNEPLGILNDPQLQRRSYSGNGKLPTANRAGELASELAENGADVDSLEFLVSSADYGNAQNPIGAGGDLPLVSIADGRRRMAGIPVTFSPFIPSGNLIIADWSRVAISYIGAPQMIVDPFTESGSGMLLMTLFQQISYAVERNNMLTVATVEA
jgi:hypothetical protein